MAGRQERTPEYDQVDLLAVSLSSFLGISFVSADLLHCSHVVNSLAMWCIDMFRIVFWFLVSAFRPCNALPLGNTAALSIRDWVDDNHSWHRVMQMMQAVNARIGIPISALRNTGLDMTPGSTPVIEVSPYDLTIIPNSQSGTAGDDLVQIDERQIMVFCGDRNENVIERCSKQEVSLSEFFEDLRLHGVRIVVPKPRLDRAPIRSWDESGDLVVSTKKAAPVTQAEAVFDQANNEASTQTHSSAQILDDPAHGSPNPQVEAEINDSPSHVGRGAEGTENLPSNITPGLGQSYTKLREGLGLLDVLRALPLLETEDKKVAKSSASACDG